MARVHANVPVDKVEAKVVEQRDVLGVRAVLELHQHRHDLIVSQWDQSLEKVGGVGLALQVGPHGPKPFGKRDPLRWGPRLDTFLYDGGEQLTAAIVSPDGPVERTSGGEGGQEHDGYDEG
jgi:hypothetical protein